MLGETTKCDLSAGIAKIDKVALIGRLNNHYLATIKKLRLRLVDYSDDISSCSCLGKDLEYMTKEIKRTAELLHTLIESDNDREIVWV